MSAIGSNVSIRVFSPLAGTKSTCVISADLKNIICLATSTSSTMCHWKKRNESASLHRMSVWKGRPSPQNQGLAACAQFQDVMFRQPTWLAISKAHNILVSSPIIRYISTCELISHSCSIFWLAMFRSRRQLCQGSNNSVAYVLLPRHDWSVSKMSLFRTEGNFLF